MLAYRTLDAELVFIFRFCVFWSVGAIISSTTPVVAMLDYLSYLWQIHLDHPNLCLFVSLSSGTCHSRDTLDVFHTISSSSQQGHCRAG